MSHRHDHSAEAHHHGHDGRHHGDARGHARPAPLAGSLLRVSAPARLAAAAVAVAAIWGGVFWAVS